MLKDPQPLPLQCSTSLCTFLRRGSPCCTHGSDIVQLELVGQLGVSTQLCRDQLQPAPVHPLRVAIVNVLHLINSKVMHFTLQTFIHTFFIIYHFFLHPSLPFLFFFLFSFCARQSGWSDIFSFWLWLSLIHI